MSVPVVDIVTPKYDTDKYPVVEDKHVKGGYHIAQDIDEMNLIPEPRRKEGMLVFNLTDEKLYIYKNNNFELFSIDTSSKYGIILSTEITTDTPNDSTFYSSLATKSLLDGLSSILIRRYDSAITYNVNDFVYKYSDDSFKMYQCIQSSTGNDVTDPTYWKEISLSTTINYGFGLIYTDDILTIDNTKIIAKWEQQEYNQNSIVLFIDDTDTNTGLYKSLKLTTNKPPHADWELIAKLSTTGGGGGETGTTNYQDLQNKPEINSVALLDNKTGEELGLLDLTKVETSLSGTQGNVPDSKATYDAITINEIKLNNTKIDPVSKSVNIDLDKNDVIGLPEELEQIKNSVTQVFTFKGQVTERSELDGIGEKVSGDVYYVENEQTFYVWDGTSWVSFVPSITSNGNTIRELITQTQYQQGEFVIYQNKIYKVLNTFTTSTDLNTDLTGGNLELRINGDGGGVITETIKTYKVTQFGDLYQIYFEKEISQETIVKESANITIPIITNDTTLNIINGNCSLINSKLGCIVTTQIVDGNNVNCIIYNIGDDLDLNTYKITFIGYSTTKPSV